MKRYAIIFLAFIFSFSGLVNAKIYRPSDVPNVHLKDKNRFVSDPDGFMTSEGRAVVDKRLRALMDSTSVEAAVVIVGDIGDADAFEFGHELASSWGLGKDDKNNGLLLLLDMGGHKVRIHTGKGMEGVLPDIACKRIIDEVIIPRLKEGKTDEAVIAATDKIYAVVTNPDVAAEVRSNKSSDSAADDAVGHIFILFVVIMGVVSIIMMIWYLLQTSGKDYYAKAGFLRSKVWVMVLFAVLSLGVGIIPMLIIIWMSKYFRNKPISCDMCGSKMQKLPEDEDNFYLTPAQDLEEKLKSVDYDVWLCPACGTTEIFPFVSKTTPYRKCPYCHTHALRLMHDRIEQRPTTMSKGRGVKVYQCMNCHKQHLEYYDIPKVAPVVVVGGVGGGRGGGGGLSSGSFGGGSFGGGGAGGSW